MPVEDKSPSRERMATVVATAAVTLAIGVTVAALAGYLVPARPSGPSGTTPAVIPATVEAPRPPATAAPDVVLVPLVPDSQAEPLALNPTQAEPERRLATNDEGELWKDDEHHRAREHHEHEDDHDDD